MANKILPISKSKVVDYSNEPLTNFWQVKDGKTHTTNQDFKRQIIDLLQSVTEGFICIQSEKLTDKKIIEQILHTARGRDVKIYILVNQYSSELDVLNGLCLIRYALHNTGSFILVNPNANQPKGMFFSGPFTGDAITISYQILTEAKEAEIAELFRHFCYHFWDIAKKEVIEKNKHQNVDVESKPIDVFYDTDAYGDKDFVYSTLFDFVQNKKRGDLADKLIVPFKKEDECPIYIKQKTENELGGIPQDSLLSREELEKFVPSLPDDGITRETTYKWSNMPFYLPDESKKSSLYSDWEKETQKIKNYLSTIIENIESVAKKENSISERISRFFLGKKTTLNVIKQKIEELKVIDFPNLIKSELSRSIDEINNLQEKVENHIIEINIEDKKAKLEEEIEEITIKINEKKYELSQKKEQLGDKEQERDKKLNQFLQDNNLQIDGLGKQKSTWGQQVGKKNKKKNPEGAQKAQDKLDELTKIENKNFIQKNKDDIGKIEKDIKHLQSTIEAKNKEKNSLRHTQSTDSSLAEVIGSKSIKPKPSSSKTFKMPVLDQQPQTGELYQKGNQKYLAIEYWEQYEQAKLEAERLNAKLCALSYFE